MDITIDAYIDVPRDSAMRQAFLGDAAYSPLRFAAQAALAQKEIRWVCIAGGNADDARSALGDAGKQSRLVLLDTPKEPDISTRHVGKSLRRWSHVGTLHGTLMTTEFCAWLNPGALLASMQRPFPDMLLYVPPTAGFLTGEIVRNLLDEGSRNGWRVRGVTADAPRGMAPLCARREWLEECVRDHTLTQAYFWSLGHFWGQQFVHVPTQVVQTRRSFELETARGREFCRAVADKLTGKLDGATLGMAEVVSAAQPLHDEWTGAMPRDVEIDITPERTVEPVYLPRQRARQAMPRALFERIVTQLGESGDSVNLTLGSTGDALEHPELEDLLKFARPHGTGLGIRTFGHKLTQEVMEKLANIGVDTVTVRLGAWGEEAYARLNGPGSAGKFDELKQRLFAIRQWQLEHRQSVLPMLVPEVVKAAEGDKTLVEFFVSWRELISHPLVMNVPVPFIDGRDVEPPVREAIKLAPGVRKPCFRIEEQMLVLADGTVPLCRRDAGAACALGDLTRQSVRDVWASAAAQRVRAAQHAGKYAEAWAGCSGCNEWFRLT